MSSIARLSSYKDRRTPASTVKKLDFTSVRRLVRLKMVLYGHVRSLYGILPCLTAPSLEYKVRRRLLLSPSQDKLFWVGGQSLGHPEDAWTEAKHRLCLGTEPGKALSVHEEIGIPEVRINQCIKVNIEALDPLRSGGQREIERIVGRRQCRQLRHERRERHIIQHLDLDLEALVQQQPMVFCRHIGFWKPQLD